MAAPLQPLTTTSIKPNVSCLSKYSRPLANFTPSVWKDYFITMPLDDSKFREASMQTELLKEEVAKMLVCAKGPVEKIELINLLYRLGVAFHFQNMIEDILNQISPHSLLDENDCDLYTVALVFRIFRQYGHRISSDVFCKYKDNNKKNFKESIIGDIKGMLGLYEAAHLKTHGEQILDNALSFTEAHLKSFAAQSDCHLGKLVINALEEPLHIGVPRLEARKYIDWYEKQEGMIEVLLKFAKVDFNRLQFLHQQELRELSIWWKNTNISNELQYARYRVVESYFWTCIMRFEPEYALSRAMHSKFITLITLVNHTYDAYGTNEETKCFTEAIERWEYGALDQLPDYMKILYKVTLDLYGEFEDQVASKGRSFSVHYAKEAFQQFVRRYQKKSDWTKEGFKPSLEQYFGNELFTGGVITMSTTFFMGMAETAGVREYEWIWSNPRICTAVSQISRLMDDISTHEDEQKRDHIPSSVECYMKQHGVAQDEAVQELQKIVVRAWKDINEECLRPTDVSMDILILFLNIARFLCFSYKGIDMFTYTEYMKDYVAQLFVHPIPV